MTQTAQNQAMLQRFQAVAEETRFQVVQLLAGGELCVCEIQEALGAAQSRLSFHLKKLKDAGLVSDRRQGRWVHYSLVPEALEEMSGFLTEARAREQWRPAKEDRDGCCGS